MGESYTTEEHRYNSWERSPLTYNIRRIACHNNEGDLGNTFLSNKKPHIFEKKRRG